MAEFDAALDRYEKKFDDIFPMFQMAHKTEIEIVDIINICIAENKDVYEMGYLSLDGDVIY